MEREEFLSRKFSPEDIKDPDSTASDIIDAMSKVENELEKILNELKTLHMAAIDTANLENIKTCGEWNEVYIEPYEKLIDDIESRIWGVAEA